MDSDRLSWLSATEAAQAIAAGLIGAEQLTEACLQRISATEAQVHAWAHLDPAHALTQARECDRARREGRPTGPLHGVPVGIKDIFDTADMPTEDGTPLHAGRTPSRDATAVALLRSAGAVILGKTVTTEFAGYAPAETRNPANLAHTPGGSSSGSAAAVAAGMVPLALGTQTNGSVIRPASFCGVYGFKPSFGLIARGGVLRSSRTLDHVGVFARTLPDVALLAEQLVGHDERDPDTAPRARPPFVESVAALPPLPPMLAYMKGPAWERTSEETRVAFAELVGALEDRVVEIDLTEAARPALDWHRTIMEAEMAASLDLDWERGQERMSISLRQLLARGREVSALDYQRACARIATLNQGFEPIFERCDAILTPAAAGSAPRGLDTTGDPAFCTLWTLCGMPAVSLPLLRGENGLPIGVQLVGRRFDDARLLRTAQWLTAKLAGR